LIGLPCVDPDGAPLGQVVAVENFGAGDLLEIEQPGGRRTLVPFRPGIADLLEDAVQVDPAFLA
jgi:16S rRNA processing protein RimM